MRANAATFILLCSCSSGLTEPSDSDTDVADTEDTDLVVSPRPELPRIAELQDLDPDEGSVRIKLVAAPKTLLVAGREIEGFAYNGQVPGPTLRLTRGDRVTAEIVNELDVPTTVHWHGLHVPNAADGAIWMREPIQPGSSVTVEFTVDQAGTYWYHPHFDTDRQVDLGLYGAIVVTDPIDPAVDDEVVIIADSWGETDETQVHGAPGGTALWTFNGVQDPVLPLNAGESARVRWINASNEGYLDLRTPGPSRWIGVDQGLAAPHEGRELLAPGDRADLEIPIGPEPFEIELAAYSLFGGAVDDSVPASIRVDPEGSALAPELLDWAFEARPPSPDPGRTDLRFVFQGDGERWYMNGEVYPDVSVPEVGLGSELFVEVRNVSPTEHPFHLHGHAFEVLSVNGTPPATRTLEDTVNVGIRETLRLRLVADNPGDWMVHCHILGHAEGGMMTVLRVVNP